MNNTKLDSLDEKFKGIKSLFETLNSLKDNSAQDRWRVLTLEQKKKLITPDLVRLMPSQRLSALQKIMDDDIFKIIDTGCRILSAAQEKMEIVAKTGDQSAINKQEDFCNWVGHVTFSNLQMASILCADREEEILSYQDRLEKIVNRGPNTKLNIGIQNAPLSTLPFIEAMLRTGAQEKSEEPPEENPVKHQDKITCYLMQEWANAQLERAGHGLHYIYALSQKKDIVASSPKGKNQEAVDVLEENMDGAKMMQAAYHYHLYDTLYKTRQLTENVLAQGQPDLF